MTGSAVRTPKDGRTGRFRLARWYASYAAFGVPQAAAPIAFALVALPLTGSAEDGAVLVMTMTAAQVAGTIPVTRLGRRLDPVTYLRVLVAVRALALASIAVLAGLGAPFPALVAAAGAAGLVSGAAFGHLRVLLNHLTTPSRLPRALGIAATTNELTFVLSPVLASAIGSLSPLVAVAAMALLGAGPLLLTPGVRAAHTPATPAARDALCTRPMALWLACTVAGTSVVAGVEIGAVALAIDFGLAPAQGFVFAVVLCLASVAGGAWVSVRNRMPAPLSVLAYLAATTAGAALIAVGHSIVTTLAGAAVVGIFLAPLGTYYSLVLDHLAPAHRRAEVFALLRTANAVGVILTSALLAITSLQVTLLGSAVLMLAVSAVAGTSLVREHRRLHDLEAGDRRQGA